MLRHLPAVAIENARKRGDRILYHLEQGTFQEVLVFQRFRPTSADGEFGLDPEDILPEGFKLERVTERRFGASLHRISRLITIDASKLQEPPTPKGLRKQPAYLGTVDAEAHQTLGH
jgi:hypothetical protein